MRQHLTKLAKKGEKLFCEVWKSASKPLTSLKATPCCNKPFCPADIFALVGLPCGVCVVVKAFDLSREKAEQLRRVGIREGARISLVSGHDPLVIVVENSRIALSRSLARHIRVQSAARS